MSVEPPRLPNYVDSRGFMKKKKQPICHTNTSCINFFI